MYNITHEEIKKLNISTNDCLKWIEEALKLKDESFLPAKCSIKPSSEVFFTSMPCLIPNLDVYGLKMVSRIPTQSPSLNSTMLLFKASTGELLSILDCNWITAMRTGAVATLSIKKAAKKGFKSIGCIGLGNTCEATLDILLNSLNKEIIVRLKKYKDAHLRIIERYKHHENISFEVVDEIEDLIKNSDIILSCVTSTSGNFGKAEWFKEGTTVIPVHTMGFQNCDLFFDKFIIDDYEHVKGFKYFNDFKEVIELKDLCRANSIRTSDQERIIAYNVGIALHDVYFAYKIYNKVNKNKDPINMRTINEKYWL